MKILFVTSEDYLPAKVGGAEWSTHYLALPLLRQGVDVRVLCRWGRGWTQRVASRIPGLRDRSTRDRGLGYPVIRAVSPSRYLPELMQHWQPEVVVAIAGFAQELLTPLAHSPTRRYLFLRDVNSPPRAPAGLGFLANSRFVSQFFQSLLHVSIPVIYPAVPRFDYQVLSSGREVLFVNPHRQKGLDLVLRLARLCPELPFHILEKLASAPLAGLVASLAHPKSAQSSHFSRPGRYAVGLWANPGAAGTQSVSRGLGPRGHGSAA